MKTLIAFSIVLFTSCSSLTTHQLASSSTDQICLPTDSFHQGDQVQVFKKECSNHPNTRWTKPICRKEILDDGIVLNKTSENCFAVKLNHLNKFDQTTFVERL